MLLRDGRRIGGAEKLMPEGAGDGEGPGVEHADNGSTLRKSGISTLR